MSDRLASIPGPNDWQALADGLAGRLVLAGERDHADLARPRVDRFASVLPTAVVRCHEPEDVASALSFARRYDVMVAVRSGGHGFAGRSSTTGLLVDVSPMDQVEVDGQVALVGAGARLGPVADRLQEHGRTIPVGTCPTVGIAGFTLGGGLGMLGRRHGLACDHLLGATVVLADATVVTVDADHHADLWWGLRGGGLAGLAVVTSLRFSTVPAPTNVTTLATDWTGVPSEDVLAAWQAWAPEAPPEVAVSLKVAAGPSGATRVVTFGAVLGGRDGAAAAMGALTAGVGADPVSADVQEMSFRDARRWWADLDVHLATADLHAFPGGTWMTLASEFLDRPLGPTARRDLFAHLADAPSGLHREVDLTPWGGAYAAPTPEATAFPHRHDRVLVKHSAEVALDDDAKQRAAARGWVAGSWEVAHRDGTGRAYPNFADADLGPGSRAQYGDNLPRLRGLADRLDPDGLLGGQLRDDEQGSFPS